MQIIPKTQELYSANIPAFQVLLATGSEYLPPEEALQRCGGKASGLLLRDVLIDELKKRPLERAGWPFSNVCWQGLS